jgi:hypothetical protein
MQVPELLQTIAILIECAVAVVAIFIATRNKRTYGWFIAATFGLFVLFDVFRIFLLPVSEELHSFILLIACSSMLYAMWLMYKEK